MRYYFNPGKILKQMFPEQTKTNLHIVIWTIIFIADLVGVYFLLDAFGISFIGNSSNSMLHEFYLFFLIGGGLVIFGLETFIYNKIHSLFR